MGSDQTDALQHARPISLRSECPLPEKAPGKLATAGNVGRPPFVMIVAGRPDRPIAVGNDPAKARCSQDFSADGRRRQDPLVASPDPDGAHGTGGTQYTAHLCRAG
jgi:hypothetical protein